MGIQDKAGVIFSPSLSVFSLWIHLWRYEYECEWLKDQFRIHMNFTNDYNLATIILTTCYYENRPRK